MPTSSWSQRGTWWPGRVRSPPSLTRTSRSPPSRINGTHSPSRVDLRRPARCRQHVPRAEWLQAERVALRAAPDDVFDYGDPRGTIELRAALANYLGRARSVVTTPDHIVICSGFAHGFALLSQAFRSAGHDSIAMEDPCLPAHRAIARDQGLTVAALPVDDDGAGRGAGRTHRSCRGRHSAHQYPTGVTLQPGAGHSW